ncbi:hypothetical protein BC829DRAFT_493913 [Chytridium lagenaria]|nr:hypothetical protein BC829DRAFT_493913 [Chytridium lagenaria]
MPDENEQAQDSAEVTSIVLEGPPIPSASVFQPVAVDGSFSANSTLHTPAIDSTEISSLQSMGPMPDEKKTVVNIPETRRLSSSIFTWMIGFSIHFWSRISYHLTKIPIYKKFRKAFPASLPFLRIWPWMFPFAWLGFRSIGIASENGVDLSQKEKENSRRIDFLNQIFDACQINEWEVLARLLEAGKLSEEFQWISGDWEGAKGDSWECLLVACREGYSSIIKILLNYGCEDLPKVIDKSDTPVLKLERPFHAALNLTSKKKAFGGMTPFIAAVRWGKAFEFIPLLLEEGGDVTKMDAAGFSALTWAAYWNNAEVLRHLHKATIKALWDNCGDDFGEHEDPLVFQPSYKNIPQSQLDASNSSVKETEAPQYHLQKACDRALLVAARNFSYEVMDILIGDGRGGPGSACLDIDNMVSFEMLHRLTLAQLRRMAGNLKVKDIRQHTTFLAIVTGRLSPFIGVPILSTILPSLEGDLNFPLYDEFGARTSLIHFVCKPKTESEQWLKVMEGYHFVPFRRTAEKPLDAEFHAKLVSDVLTLLVKKKVDIDEIDPATGFTPLHVAVTHSNFDLVKCLLNLGADPNALSQKQTFTKLPRTGALNDGSAQMMESAFEHKSEGAKSLSIALDDSTRVGTGVISQRIMAVRRKKPNRAKTVQPPLEEVAASTSGIVPEVPSSSSIPALQVANQPETITQVTSSSSEVVSDVASSSSVPRPEPASMPQPLAETDSLDAARESTATSSSSSKRSNSKKDREASRGGLITPLHLAKRSNIAEILLDNGADLSIRSSISRRLPIHHLCQSLHDPKIFPTNKVEEGPLQGAFEESLNVIKIMTSPDAPEDWRTATDADGCTALHLAALENSPAAKAICKLLLERGIAWTIVNGKRFHGA